MRPRSARGWPRRSRFFASSGWCLGEGDQGGVGGVAEGTQHSGDISKRRLLGSALSEAFGGFAFEVEDDEVAAGAENLPEMVVAMDANALAEAVEVVEAMARRERERSTRLAENESGVVGGDPGELGQAALQGFQRKRELGVDSAGVRDEVFGGEGFGGKGRIVGRRGQGKMHLGGAAAEQGSRVDVRSGVLASQSRRRLLMRGSWQVTRESWQRRRDRPAGAGRQRCRSNETGHPGSTASRRLRSGPDPAAWRRLSVRHPRGLSEMSPRNGAIRVKWAVSVRKRPISVSGFSPGWRRRKSFRMNLSP